MKVAVIGGGAAGMMCAATLSQKNFDGEIYLIEKNAVLGYKVMISGGGRCNVTTGIWEIPKLLERYPRGKNFLKFAMHTYSPEVIYNWFERNGVELKIEEDLRVFPKSNTGKDIVKVFDHIFQKNEVRVGLRQSVIEVKKVDEKFELTMSDSSVLTVDKLVLTTGGQAYRHTGSTGDGYSFAANFGHTITKLAPSLNAFILKENWVKDLAGVSFKKVGLKLNLGKKFEFGGPILFTHKGITGPAVFAMSSLAAYELADSKVEYTLNVDFLPEMKHTELEAALKTSLNQNPKKLFKNIDLFVPKSVAEVVAKTVGIPETKANNELSKSEINRTIEILKNFPVTIVGQSAGDEFVTAGGIDLKEIDSKTMESKICKNLYFAGEIMDIDGFTGGFNLQAAWATGKLAGESI